MKRDMDLLREILLFVEAETNLNMELTLDISHWEYDKKYLANSHVELLEDAGLVRQRYDNSQSIDLLTVGRITFLGYDYLDTIRDPELWSQTKEAALNAGGWTLDLLSEIAKGFIKSKILKHTGVEI